MTLADEMTKIILINLAIAIALWGVIILFGIIMNIEIIEARPFAFLMLPGLYASFAAARAIEKRSKIFRETDDC